MVPGGQPRETVLSTSEDRSRFRRHIENRLADAVLRVPIDVREELYVVGLWLAPELRDERRVTATMGWNTISDLRRRAAGDPGAALFEWSVGNFVQPTAAVVADTLTDPPGAELRRRWLESEGLWYPDDRGDLAVTEEDPEIWDQFLALMVDIVRDWHASGELSRAVGRDVPVFLDAMGEDEDAIRELNRAANPPSLHALVDRWSTKPVGAAQLNLLKQL